MLEFLKSHWWKIVLAIVIVWIIFRWAGSHKQIISKEPGNPEPGKTAPVDGNPTA